MALSEQEELELLTLEREKSGAGGEPATVAATRSPTKPVRPLTRDNPGAIDDFLIGALSRAPGLGNLASDSYIPDNIQGSIPGRLIQGAADLPIGALQVAAEYSPARMMLGIKNPINERIAAIEERTNQLRGPNAGFDWARLAGNVLSPAALMAAAKVPLAATRMGKVGQGVGIGAVGGLTAPVTDGGENFASSKALQTAGGMALGGAIPALAPLVTAPIKAGYHALVEPWLQPAAIKGRAFLEAAGDKADDIIRLLRENKQLVSGSKPTAGEAAADAGSTTFSALQKQAADIAPDPYYARGAEQNAARIAGIRTVGRDRAALSAAEKVRAENASEGYGAVRDDLIDPRSTAQIMDDAITARSADASRSVADVRRLSGAQEAAERQAQNYTPVEGMPRIAGRYSYADELGGIAERKASEAADASLRSGAEKRYLQSFNDIMKESGALDNVSFGAFVNRPSVQNAIKSAIEGAKETGGYFPKPGEKFSVGNLQRIKASISDAVSKPEIGGGLAATERAEITKTLDKFVKWLSMKSPGWAEARMQYATDSRPINQMKVGQFLEEKLVPALSDDAKQRSTVYAQALRDAPGTIKRATGAPRYDELTEVLTPAQLSVVNGIRDDLARGAKFEDLARKGAKAAPDISAASGDHKITGMFDRTITIANAIIGRLEGKVNKRLAAEIASEMLNPPKVAETLAQAQARAQRNKALATMVEKSIQTGTLGATTAAQRK